MSVSKENRVVVKSCAKYIFNGFKYIYIYIYMYIYGQYSCLKLHT